jgi:hypothetical protein
VLAVILVTGEEDSSLMDGIATISTTTSRSSTVVTCSGAIAAADLVVVVGINDFRLLTV